MARRASTPTNGAPGPVGGPFARWPRTADAVLATLVFVVLLAVSPEGNDGDLVLRPLQDTSPGELAVSGVASGVLWWRRSRPIAVFGISLVVVTFAGAVGYSELNGIAMLVALYGVGRYVTDHRWSYGGLGTALAFVAISAVFDGSTVAEAGFGVVLMFVVWYVGRRLRIRGEYAAQREREHAAEARRAVAEERTRIARELHDVVAHRVSLMTVQAGAAKTVAADDPDSASQAMHAVETAGRQALDELRHLLGVLRPDAEGDALVPQPGLSDIPQLVDQFRAAGMDVTLTLEHAGGDVPARVGLSAYRIVQEALTNTLKHAGPDTRTEVRLTTGTAGVGIEVLDDGRGGTILAGSGHGILGMRERAVLLGGSLDAGPRRGGGFEVVARLPVRDDAP